MQWHRASRGIYGLYATIVPLLAYALFGPSRILVLGPDFSLAAIILGVVLAALRRRPLPRYCTGRNDGSRIGVAASWRVWCGLVS